MSNFNFEDSSSVSYARGGRRPRSTIAPTIVFREGRPILAIGIPGGARIPTAMLQVLLDHLALGRPLAEAMGDTRMHFASSAQREDVDTVEGERSFPAAEAAALQTRGWKIVLPEEAGRGRHFGGMAAVALNPDGTLTGFADPRRTNAAAGW